MSEKVLKAGIEDVLSSIKRLVSEEERKAPGVLTSSVSQKAGRLVLTDALRVGETANAEEQTNLKDATYRADDSIKPMVLRASDIVEHAEPASEQNGKPEPDDTPAESLSAKIEALEAAIAKTEDQWEPDGDSEDAYAGTSNTTLLWDATDEFDLTASESEADNVSERESEEGKPTAATFVRGRRAQSSEAGQVAPQILDEDALRSLIAQVVREELQGVLGQRITRNVRKMVRREIYRVLAEQKLT